MMYCYLDFDISYSYTYIDFDVMCSLLFIMPISFITCYIIGIQSYEDFYKILTIDQTKTNFW